MDSPMLQFVRSTSAIESGFIAAGITVSAIVVIQTLYILLSWIIFSV